MNSTTINRFRKSLRLALVGLGSLVFAGTAYSGSPEVSEFSLPSGVLTDASSNLGLCSDSEAIIATPNRDAVYDVDLLSKRYRRLRLGRNKIVEPASNHSGCWIAYSKPAFITSVSEGKTLKGLLLSPSTDLPGHLYSQSPGSVWLVLTRSNALVHYNGSKAKYYYVPHPEALFKPWTSLSLDAQPRKIRIETKAFSDLIVASIYYSRISAISPGRNNIWLATNGPIESIALLDIDNRHVAFYRVPPVQPYAALTGVVSTGQHSALYSTTAGVFSLSLSHSATLVQAFGGEVAATRPLIHFGSRVCVRFRSSGIECTSAAEPRRFTYILKDSSGIVSMSATHDMLYTLDIRCRCVRRYNFAR